jgi:hypothetical protein
MTWAQSWGSEPLSRLRAPPRPPPARSRPAAAAATTARGMRARRRKRRQSRRRRWPSGPRREGARAAPASGPGPVRATGPVRLERLRVAERLASPAAAAWIPGLRARARPGRDDRAQTDLGPGPAEGQVSPQPGRPGPGLPDSSAGAAGAALAVPGPVTVLVARFGSVKL